jgi:3,4-dihydroxy-2-butanone 4-phosphate synthase
MAIYAAGENAMLAQQIENSESIHRSDRGRLATALRTGQLALLLGFDRQGTQCAMLVADARTVTADAVNMMAMIGRSVVCCAVDDRRAMRLGLELIAPVRSGGIAYCRSVEAATGVSTGISAADRATTLNVIASHFPAPDMLVKPGHIMPNLIDPDMAATSILPDAVLPAVSSFTPVTAVAWCYLLDEHGNVATHRQARAIAHRAGVPMLPCDQGY